MPTEPAAPRPTSLLVAATPQEGAAAFGPAPHDVRFATPDDLTTRPGQLDLGSAAEVFLGIGEGQRRSLAALVDALHDSPEMAPDVFIEIPAETRTTDSTALLEMLRTLDELASERTANGRSVPRIFLHASDRPDLDLTHELERLRSREVRAAMENASAGGPAASATDSAVRKGNAGKSQSRADKKRIARQAAELAATQAELDVLRRRDLVAGWHSRLRSAANRAHVRMPAHPRLVRVVIVVAAVALVLGAGLLGWTSSLGFFGAVIGVFVAGLLLSTGILMVELARVRATQLHALSEIAALRRENLGSQRKQRARLDEERAEMKRTRKRLEVLAKRSDKVLTESRGLRQLAAEINADVGGTRRTLEEHGVGLARLAAARPDRTYFQQLERRLIESTVAATRSEVARAGGALDALEDRLIAAWRLRLDELKEVELKEHSATRKGVTSTERRLIAAGVGQTRQVEAVANLHAMNPVSSAVPPMGGWAASPDLLRFLVREMSRLRPTTVVECGSGASTVWFALTAERLGLDTRIVSLEHEAGFREQTIQALRDHGLAGRVDVRHAPILPLDGDGQAPWYDTAAIEDLEEIGLVLVDGPPAKLGPRSRFPAVPVLRNRLAESCLIVLDDLNRSEEQEIAGMWRRELPDFEYEVLDLEKGAGVFRRHSSGG